METLKNNELIEIKGGALRIGLATLIAVVTAVVIGIVDGIRRPLPCRR